LNGEKQRLLWLDRDFFFRHSIPLELPSFFFLDFASFSLQNCCFVEWHGGTFSLIAENNQNHCELC
jgi:hypothetical protein